MHIYPMFFKNNIDNHINNKDIVMDKVLSIIKNDIIGGKNDNNNIFNKTLKK